MYDPSVGRWLEQDPIGFDARDADLYRYVGNNPTNGVDPSGLDVIFLNDPKGARGYGHSAVLIGNDKDGWVFFSYGEDMKKNGGLKSIHFRDSKGKPLTLSQIFKGEYDEQLKKDMESVGYVNLGRYERYIRYKTNSDADREALMQAIKWRGTEYELLSHNCSDMTADALKAAGADFDNLGPKDNRYLSPNNKYYGNKGRGHGSGSTNDLK